MRRSPGSASPDKKFTPHGAPGGFFDPVLPSRHTGAPMCVLRLARSFFEYSLFFNKPIAFFFIAALVVHFFTPA